MNKALKTTMILYGIGGALFGLFYLFLPQQAIEMQAPEIGDIPTYLITTKMTLGAIVAPAAIFGIIAARDPIKNIFFVKFVIAFAILLLAVALYSGFVLYGDVSQAAVGIILHGGFGAALLAFYPWRRDGK